MALCPNLAASDFRNQRPAYPETGGYILTTPLGSADGFGARPTFGGAHGVEVSFRERPRLGAASVPITSRCPFGIKAQGVAIPLWARAMANAILRVLKGRGPSQVVGTVVVSAAIIVRNLMRRTWAQAVEGFANERVNVTHRVLAIHKQVDPWVARPPTQGLRKHFLPSPELIRNRAANAPKGRDLIVGGDADQLPCFHNGIVCEVASNRKLIQRIGDGA